MDAEQEDTDNLVDACGAKICSEGHLCGRCVVPVSWTDCLLADGLGLLPELPKRFSVFESGTELWPQLHHNCSTTRQGLKLEVVGCA